MACVWKHRQSRFWFARFTDATGRRRNHSTKETSKRKALAIAKAFEAAARDNRAISHARAVIERLHRELTGEG